jgi:hypothetical protein
MTNKPDTLPEGRLGAGRLEELAGRVEALSGPDREVGREVLRACGWTQTAVGYFMGPLTIWRSPNGSTRFDDDDFAQHDPTASIDAAMQLVPTDGSIKLLDLELGWEPDDAAVRPAVSVLWYPPRKSGKDWHAMVVSAATIPLTITAAALALHAAAIRAQPQSLLNQEKPK